MTIEKVSKPELLPCLIYTRLYCSVSQNQVSILKVRCVPESVIFHYCSEWVDGFNVVYQHFMAMYDSSCQICCN